jgi:hypothetical protein
MRSRLLLALMLAGLLATGFGSTPTLLLPTPASAHPEPGDVDGDGVFDAADNCPTTRNADQRNSDGDGRPGADVAGDACDDDDDADGIPDVADNCRIDVNPDQRDADGDGLGDACAGDRDGDGVRDARDNCPERPNGGQEDGDRDGVGDLCDPDDDDDGVFDERDGCPWVANPDQVDADADGHGRACDPDDGDHPVQAIDLTPPRVRVGLAAPARFAALRAGLPVTLRCSEACAATATLRLGRRAAARHGAGLVGRGEAQVAAAGRTYVFIRFGAAARRALRRQPGVRLALRVVVLDAARNARILTRTVRIRW